MAINQKIQLRRVNVPQHPILWNERRDHSVWKSQKKVAFNIASEASYVYTVLPDMSHLIGQKLKKNSNATFLVIFKHCAWALLGWEDLPQMHKNDDSK